MGWDARSERWMRARTGKKILQCWPAGHPLYNANMAKNQFSPKVGRLGNVGKEERSNLALLIFSHF